MPFGSPLAALLDNADDTSGSRLDAIARSIDNGTFGHGHAHGHARHGGHVHHHHALVAPLTGEKMT